MVTRFAKPAALFAAAIMATTAPALADGAPSGFLGISDAQTRSVEAPTLQTVRFEGQRGVRGAFGPSIGEDRFGGVRSSRPSGAFFSRGARSGRKGETSVFSIFGLDRRAVEPSRINRPPLNFDERTGR